MTLQAFSVQDFQSYRDRQTVTIDSSLTLIAGRNNVGKSALLRALRIFTEAQEGAGPSFELGFVWRINVAELRAYWPSGSEADRYEKWVAGHDELTLSATFSIAGEPPTAAPGNLAATRIELSELAAVALAEPGTGLGWESGPFVGSGFGTDKLMLLVNHLVREIAFIGPRLIEQGQRQIEPRATLEPNARNLANVLTHVQLATPTTTFASLLAFMQEAFPEIETITTMPIGDSSMTEPAIFYRHAPTAPIPLRLCGSGIEQMVALSLGILTVEGGRLFLIDEPQAYLHPHAERSLLRLLEQYPEHQYVIATNSGFLLNARPLQHARLLTIESGATAVTEFPSPQQLLAELEITAADLWLAESVLWVEGPSDEEVFDLLVTELPAEQRSGLSIRRMPGAASRFTAESERRASETYRFCDEVTAAVSPLKVRMLFVFDADDKTEEVRRRITESSKGRAEFLPVRELENLFLRADLLCAALAERCALLERLAPTLEVVEGELGALLAMTDDRKLYPRALVAGDNPRERVHGSELIDRLYWKFTTSEYDKGEDARALALISLEMDAAILDPLRVILAELLS